MLECVHPGLRPGRDPSSKLYPWPPARHDAVPPPACDHPRYHSPPPWPCCRRFAPVAVHPLRTLEPIASIRHIHEQSSVGASPAGGKMECRSVSLYRCKASAARTVARAWRWMAHLARGPTPICARGRFLNEWSQWVMVFQVAIIIYRMLLVGSQLHHNRIDVRCPRMSQLHQISAVPRLIHSHFTKRPSLYLSSTCASPVVAPSTSEVVVVVPRLICTR